ncbi:MAG: adenine deaminase [Anaerolineales bacterium]|nr:MAG: adenine deaminase [Anaerolineales bacterium]
MELGDLIKVARGDEPADLLLKHAKVINVFTGDIQETHIAIVHSRIVGMGDYQAREVVDLGGRYVCPGFIDAHVHIESAMVPPSEFARAVVPRGTTTVVADPHEIANVLGLEGIRYMLEMAKYNPLSIYFMAPSCVPSTEMETTGAALHWYDLQTLQHEPYVLGLGEMMNFPGVVNGMPEVLDKLRAFQGRVKDGHAPGLKHKSLMAYTAANIGSDHECTTVEEAREKLGLGMFLFLREATNARNLRDLLPVVNPHTSRRLCFCTDDRMPADLLDEGHIDHMVRLAIAEGIDPVTAIRMATLNPSEYFHLHDRGAIAPARRADLVVFSDLRAPRCEMAYRGGRLVAQDGQVIPWERPQRHSVLRSSMNVDWSNLSLRILPNGRQVRLIGLIPDQVITEHLVEELPIREDEVMAAPSRDILKLAVIERHLATGNVGLGFVKGLGLQKGAIASTVAHDHHNIVVAGADDESMFTAVQAIAATRGGMAAAYDGTVLAQLPLPIAGLMSDQPIETVRRQVDEVLAAAKQLGSPLHDPFMALSFLALPVIPSLKLTDRGLVDVGKFQLVPLFAS